MTWTSSIDLREGRRNLPTTRLTQGSRESNMVETKAGEAGPAPPRTPGGSGCLTIDIAEDTHQKALRVNLDPRWYGTVAEIGAGQEVARWFFRVGGAAGTIAKSISAYDMAVSDAIYGEADRYVSAGRLQAMLDHEYQLNIERLGDKRGDTTSFFAFANTVVARSYKGTNECHGWMGLKFRPIRDDPSQVILHVRMLDVEASLQQEAIGIVGINLLHGAFFQHHEPEALLESLLDRLTVGRIEIDMIEFRGIEFRHAGQSTDGAEAGPTRSQWGSPCSDPIATVLQPSEALRKTGAPRRAGKLPAYDSGEPRHARVCSGEVRSRPRQSLGSLSCRSPS